jgi:hypothetical protein
MGHRPYLLSGCRDFIYDFGRSSNGLFDCFALAALTGLFA